MCLEGVRLNWLFQTKIKQKLSCQHYVMGALHIVDDALVEWLDQQLAVWWDELELYVR